MDVTYRRHQPASRLERLLACVVPAKPIGDPMAIRIDFVVTDDLVVSQE